MRGASQPRYTWYLAHTPTTTPTKVPTGPLKLPTPPPLVCLPAGFFSHRHTTRMKDVIVDSIGSPPPPTPPLSVCCVYVLSSALSLSFCRVYVGSALLSEPHIYVNSVFTFEVLHHASLRPLRPSPSLLRCFDSLSCYGELADPQIMPLSLFQATCCWKKNQHTWFRCRQKWRTLFYLVWSVPLFRTVRMQLHQIKASI